MILLQTYTGAHSMQDFFEGFRPEPVMPRWPELARNITNRFLDLATNSLLSRSLFFDGDRVVTDVTDKGRELSSNAT